MNSRDSSLYYLWHSQSATLWIAEKTIVIHEFFTVTKDFILRKMMKISYVKIIYFIQQIYYGMCLV